MILQLYFYKHTMNIIYVIVEIKYLMEIEILICLINFQICTTYWVSKWRILYGQRCTCSLEKLQLTNIQSAIIIVFVWHILLSPDWNLNGIL